MRRMLKLFLLFFIFYLISILLLFLLQEKIIFRNVKLEHDYVYKFMDNFEEVTIKTSDDNSINALYFKVDKPKGVLLYFHGNAGSLKRWGDITSYFTKYNYNVFVMDYRNYGKSTGKFNEGLMYKDAQLCYEYVKKIFNEDKITIYGRSLGCAFATKIASENKPKQLILEAPFYNLTHVAKYHYPFIPFNLLMKYKFETNKLIKKVNCKTTFFHGIKDKVIPFNSGKKLFNTSIKNQSNFISIKEGTHHNLMRFELYENTITKLLD